MGEGSGKVRYSKFLGDMYIDADGVNLRNVEVSLGVGDLEARLHGGVLSEGLNRIVVSGFVGDVRIYLPREMEYLASCSNFVGDLEIGGERTSGLGNNLESQSTGYDQAPQKVYIAANSFVGDIKIYSL